MIDTNKYKPQIRRYLQLKGIKIHTNQVPNVCKCPNPNHTDKNPSAVIYDDFNGEHDPGLKCFGCNLKMSIFDVAGFLCGSTDFTVMRDDVIKTLGGTVPEVKKEKKKKQEINLVKLPIEKAREIFTEKRLLSMSEFIGKKNAEKNGLQITGEEAQKTGFGNKITGMWPYLDSDGLVEIIDVRFEGGPKKKNVITFYWNGKHIKSKNPPVKIYGLDKLKKYPTHKRLIVEGAKKAKAGECLEQFGFTVHGWSGGSGKVLFADWTPFLNEDNYILPDDDHEINKLTGQEWDVSQQPGMKAAIRLKSYLKNLKIVPFFVPAREIKKSGADLVEVLQILSPEQCANYILNFPRKQEGKKEIVENDKLPFKILGTAEDGKSYFIDRHGRLYDFKLDTISQRKLNMLAPITYWKEHSGTTRMSQEDWMYIMDDIIELAGRIDFDTDNIRGRGAWREQDGRICYHDGIKTIGEFDSKKIFLRKTKNQIGIDKEEISYELCEKIKEIVFELSFNSPVDAMRCLGFSSIAAFSGALQWRPQAFITGPSQSGKSQIEMFVVRPISMALPMNGGETTAAGYIFQRNRDCGCVTIEEFEKDTEKKKINRENLLSVMRQSTSDDTPLGYKGTADQKSISYMTRDMICFIAISEEIESVADDNRLTKIRTKKPENQKRSWGEMESDLIKYLCKENCMKIRSKVWKNLKKIISLSREISIEIKNQTLSDHRFAISEGTLMATYMIIWKNETDITKEKIKDFVSAIYGMMKPEDSRNEAEEMIDLILEEKVRVFQTEFSISEILEILRTEKIESESDTDYEGLRTISTKEKIEFKRAIENNGVYLQDGFLGIANSHKEIRRIIKSSKGYSAMLKRHPKFIQGDKNINRNGVQKKCSMFDIFEVEPPF